MSVTLYDKALLSKLNIWTEGTKLHVFSPSDARHIKEVIADEVKDSKIKLPFIVLSRPDGFELQNSNWTPLASKGMVLHSDEDRVTTLNAIPINIEYNIDVYARYLEEADAYARELIFNIINYPKVQVVIPYLDINYNHNSSIRFSSDIISDISEEVGFGRNDLSCLRMSIAIDDAYIWDVRNKATVKLASDGLYVEINSSTTDKVLEPVVFDE